MELLATFAESGKELFEYNRDYYTFDQKQWLDREMLRLEMQIKRFDLFRDDIRDLIELTTSKMEMYHMVGALCLEFCVIVITEGAELAWISTAPPFMKSLYALSFASAFMYILLAVWLSMHASVSAHSFGVRLLTRFVRLPIPGSQEVNQLNAKLTDFERQGAKEMLRVPFVGNAQDWQRIRAQGVVAEQEQRPTDGDERFRPGAQGRAGRSPDLLGRGEEAINDHDLTDAATKLPGHHVQLFRRLQAKWQCYDCYARVCMSLGAYHMLAAISYYLIIVCMRHYTCPTTGYSVITVFMVVNIGIGILDVGSQMARYVAVLHLFGAIPVYMAAWSMSTTLGEDLVQREEYPYPLAPIIFLLAVLWHEGLLQLAHPSKDGMSLPRRFRTVLFIDVFAVADEALKNSVAPGDSRLEQAGYSEEQVYAAEQGLFHAEWAVRRWRALPATTNEAKANRQELERLKKTVFVKRKMLNCEAARLASKIGDKAAMAMMQVDNRAYHEMDAEELEEDPFKGFLIGPFQNVAGGDAYYFDVDTMEFVWSTEGREVLTLTDVSDIAQEVKQQVFAVLGGRLEGDDDEDGDSDDGMKKAVSARQGTQTSFIGGGLMNVQGQRLPWKVVHGITRALQVAWLFCGIMYGWQSYDRSSFRYDKYLVAGERRLGATTNTWSFESREVMFPRGAFFRVAGLSCLPGASAEQVLVTSEAGQLYRAGAMAATAEAAADAAEVNATAARRPRRLEALGASSYPSGTVALCPDVESVTADGNSCLAGQLTEGGIAFWQLGGQHAEAVELPVEGRRWQLLAGAMVPCEGVAGLMVGLDDSLPRLGGQGLGWCLLLAGWDGEQLPVAALRLPRGLGTLPAPTAVVSPALDAPLSALRSLPAEGGEGPLALSLEPRRGRLWALLSSGELQVWELLGDEPQSLGRWAPPLEGLGAPARPDEKQRVVGLCEDGASGALLLATRGGSAAEHRLLRAVLPAALV